MNKKSEKYFTIAIFAILLLLMLIGTFFDFEISQKLCALNKGSYYSSNFILRWTEILGDVVLFALVSIGAVSVMLSEENIFNFNKYAIIITKILSCLILVGVNIFGVYKVVGYMAEHFLFKDKLDNILSMFCYVFGGLAFSLICFTVVSKFSKNTLNCLSKWALIVVLTVLLSQIAVQGSKLLTNRVRFRTMNYFQDFSYYSKWYVFNFNSHDKLERIKLLIGVDGYRSFPSGHTASAGSIITIVAIPDFCINLQTKRIKIILLIISLTYTFFIGLTRIFIGAHFLTDVVFSTLITYAVFYLSRYVINKTFNRKRGCVVELEIER